jgi:3-phenylpropionate/trans-cinnamate dioxygenase ferredoxin reductase component
MAQKKFKYVIVGAGLSGCSAIEGIRTLDKTGSILLIGDEKHLPYNRPPLSKQLWFGKKTVEQIFVKPQKYYADNQADVVLNTKVVKIDATNQTIDCTDGNTYQYEKLLLATGGTPNRLDIKGGDLGEICYFRYLDDFLKLKSEVSAGTKALVIGGGFIGSEMAAALNINKADVTLLMHGTYLAEQVFPKSLGLAVNEDFIHRGVKIITQDGPASIARQGRNLVTRTENGKEIVSDVIVTGIGIKPETQIAQSGGLAIENGVTVNEFMQTSSPNIYAAGDNANFPYQALGRQMRVEHWDNAVNQGKTAGMNMAGARSAYTYMPYFFSDLFDFGYEAVGMVSSKLETFADWQEENRTGVIYYLEDSKVRGVMCCNVWNKVDAARELIRSGQHMTARELHEAVK